jgi:signal transduction histidine kinase
LIDGETLSLKKLRVLSKTRGFQSLSLSLVPSSVEGLVREVFVLGNFNEEPKAPLGSSENLESQGMAKLLESMLANAPLGFALLDEQLHFVCVNPVFIAMTELTHEKPGVSTFDNDLIPLLNEILETGNSELNREVILKKGDIAENSKFAEMSFYPIPDREGNVCGIAIMAIDITERKRADLSLKKATDEFIRSNMALEYFCHVASHDLNEPLRMISSYVQLLEKKYRAKLDLQAIQYINFAVDGAKQMRNLIDGILSFSKTGKIKLNFVELEIEKKLQSVIKRLKTNHSFQDWQVTSGPLPMVVSDKSYLAEIFYNLIDNAIKFRSVVPCQIHVTAKKESSFWLFTITDNGKGIPEESLKDVFIAFTKLEPDSKYANSGLGLAVCQRNIKELGGEIWATSTLGQGSAFHFTLPIQNPEAKFGN